MWPNGTVGAVVFGLCTDVWERPGQGIGETMSDDRAMSTPIFDKLLRELRIDLTVERPGPRRPNRPDEADGPIEDEDELQPAG